MAAQTDLSRPAKIQAQFTPGNLASSQTPLDMTTIAGQSLRPGVTVFNPEPQSESQLRELYAAAQRAAKQQRDSGFMGQVVLPGEGSFEEFVKMQNRPLLSTGLQDPQVRLGPDDVSRTLATGNRSMADTGKAINTDVELMAEMGKQAGNVSTSIPKVTDTLIPDPSVEAGTQMDTSVGQLGAAEQADTAQVDTTMPGLTVDVPETPGAGVGQIDQIASISPELQKTGVDVAQIEKDISVDLQEGTLSAGAIAEAATEELDERATVQYQLSELLSGIEEGKPLPPWASPAARKVAGVMQARGLGASSMAGAAITQAVMESGIPIAAKDADAYAKIQLANLTNRQRTALQNAAAQASMDTANLNARLKAGVTNAQLLLATETKNMDANQQANVLEYNALTQALFKDAAEENARKQFNAKNELQVEEFFAELESQVETANANRLAAIEQANAGEANAQNQFNASLRDARNKFNANMKYAIDQSNVQWRREINTANTAIQNENNRINVQNALNVSQTALNNLWQMYRDNAAWNFQKSESALQRQHEIGIMAMEFANTQKMYEKEQKDNLAMGIGNWLALWAAGTSQGSSE